MKENEKPGEPTQGGSEKKTTRSTVDLQGRDRARLEELSDIFDGMSNVEVFRTCLRIVHAQVMFIRKKPGNRIELRGDDGTTVLLPLEILALDKENRNDP